MKKKIKLLIPLFIILLCISYIYFYMSTNYKYLVGNNLMNNSQLILDGDLNKDEDIVVKIDSNNLFAFLRNKKVKVKNYENLSTVYNIFEFQGFNPYVNYDVTLQLNISGLDPTTKLLIGTQEIKGQNFVDENTGKRLNNVQLNNTMEFSVGYSDFISVPLNFTANEEGNIYVGVGIEVGEEEALDYTIKNVRLKL